jgi:hypothetical protein
MAKKKKTKKRPPAPAIGVTVERANRLFRLLRQLGQKPQSRQWLVKNLKLGVRGFYRDLEALRAAGIDIVLEDGSYRLAGNLQEAISLLPFPDPGLTLGDAEQLARGKTKAHQKLKQQVDRIKKG